MINIKTNQFAHFKRNIFPDLTDKKVEPNKIQILEKDQRLTLYLSEATGKVVMNSKDFTLAGRVAAWNHFHSDECKADLQALVALIKTMRVQGIVHTENAHVSIFSILLNLVHESLLYAQVNSCNDTKLKEASMTIVKGLSVLMVNYGNFQKHLAAFVKAIAVVKRSIKENIPGEDIPVFDAVEKSLEAIKEIDSPDKRWAFLCSPWMIEHWDDLEKAPYTTSTEGQKLLYRDFPIEFKALGNMVKQHCLSLEILWKMTTSSLMGYFKEIQIEQLYKKMNEAKFDMPLHPTSAEYAYIEECRKSIEAAVYLDQTLRLNNCRSLKLIESLVENHALDNPEVLQKINSLVNMLGLLVEVCIRVQNANSSLLNTLNIIQKMLPDFTCFMFKEINRPFIKNTEKNLYHISTLNEFMQPLVGWSLALEQHNSRNFQLSEEDKLGFLPAGLPKKGTAKPKSKTPPKKALAKRDVRVIPSPVVSGKEAKPVKSNPVKAIPAPVLKQEVPSVTDQMILDTDPSSLQPKQVVIRSLPAAKHVIVPGIRPVDASEMEGMQRHFSKFVKDRDIYQVKTAAQADLNYSMLKGLSRLNHSINVGNHDELLFLSRTALGSVNLFIEATMLLSLNMKEKSADFLNHNLWKYLRNFDQKVNVSVIKRHYLGSYWTRFMREQIKEWKKSGKAIPKLLSYLVDVADREPKACMKVQKCVSDWIGESIDFSNELMEKVCKHGGSLSVPVESGLNEKTVDGHQKSPWIELIPDVEQLTDKGNVWIRQWTDDLRSLNGAWRFIHAANSPEVNALVVSSVHGLLHSAVQSPLYALQYELMADRISDHRLAKVWEEAFNDPKKSLPATVHELLNEASISSRYPYEHDKPTSSLHRLQLEAISLLASPDFNDRFKPVRENKAEIVFDPDTGMPLLNQVGTIEEQRKALKAACLEVADLLKKQLLPEVQARLSQNTKK